MFADANGKSQVTIEGGSTIDLTGLWTNALLDPNVSGLAYLNGGTLNVTTTGGITLAAGSLVDVSSGGAILANGKTQGGKGGSVSLLTNDYDNVGSAARPAPRRWFSMVRYEPTVSMAAAPSCSVRRRPLSSARMGRRFPVRFSISIPACSSPVSRTTTSQAVTASRSPTAPRSRRTCQSIASQAPATRFPPAVQRRGANCGCLPSFSPILSPTV